MTPNLDNCECTPKATSDKPSEAPAIASRGDDRPMLKHRIAQLISDAGETLYIHPDNPVSVKHLQRELIESTGTHWTVAYLSPQPTHLDRLRAMRRPLARVATA